MKKPGKVYLVGAGPGDPGLLTLRGAELISRAEVLVYDALVNESLLDLAPQSAARIFAGKACLSSGRHKKDAEKIQEKIHSLLLRYAQLGKIVVRLKGGDPFIFGRGGEEASFLREHKIEFEIVPGVTAGYSAAAYAGIPVTDRRFSSLVTFVTAHENPEGGEKARVNWQALACLGGTVVAYMGAKNLSHVTDRLIQEGLSPETPAAMIERGTCAGQRVVTGRVKDIAAKANLAGIRSPALAIFGEVNHLRKKIQWFESKPLFGKTILLTRPKHQSQELRRALEEHGANVLEFHSIAFKPPVSWEKTDQSLRNFSQFDWVVFTSPNGVRFFFDRLMQKRKDARIFGGKKIASIGSITAREIEKRGIRPDLAADPGTSKELLRLLSRESLKGRQILLARTDIAPAFLRKGLQECGARVTELAVYRTVKGYGRQEQKKLENQIEEGKIHAITFTSESTVENFFKAISGKFRKKLKTKMISIGPVTTQALKRHGYQPWAEAREQSYQGIVQAILKKAKSK